jgi:glutamine synthetase
MDHDLAAMVRDKGMKYLLFSFTDLFGVMRSKLVPAHAVEEMQDEGAGFAGFAAHLDMTPADPDLWAVPDPASLIQLPWQPELGWVATNLVMNDEPVGHAPRVVLTRTIEAARARGFQMKSGVECEFFLLEPDGSGIADGQDTQDKPCYDQMALLRRYELIREICDVMNELGWGPYQNDHEDANGQFEMNWNYSDALTTADRHAFFKFMVRHLAEKHGLRATFMPKPFTHLTGSGCHVHFSLWDAAGDTNVFLDESEEMGLSETAYHFLGGVLHAAPALAAITNPTINSYKRLNAPTTASGSTWAPNAISYAGNNRTHMVRIPDAGRLETRLPDGAANPYLLQAALLAAGLDGIEQRREPGERLDNNMYEAGPEVDVPRLPLNLLDALRNLDGSPELRAGLGDELVGSYVSLKMANWHDFMSHTSEWERANTLDI